MTDFFKKIGDKALFVVVFSIVLGFIGQYLLFDLSVGVNFFIFIVLVLAGIFLLGRKNITGQSVFLGVLILFFSAMFFVRDSESLIFFNVLACLLLLLALAQNLVGLKLKEFLMLDYLKLAVIPIFSLPPFFKTLSIISTSRKEKSGGNAILGRLFKGFLFSLPLVVLFLILFSSADLVFHKYITDFFRIDQDFFARFVFMSFLAIASCVFFSYIIHREQALLTQEAEGKKTNFGYVEGITVLSVIATLFFVFIVLQIAYLFGGESNISDLGFSYAEYARRGFGELVAVAIFAFLILYAKDKYLEKTKETAHGVLFKILSSVLVLEVLVIMISAFKRLWLYEEAFGFTVARLYAMAFIIWLALIFIFLLYKISVNGREKDLVFYMFLSVTVFLAGLNLLNPDAFIAKTNIDRFKNLKDEKLDVPYIYGLSADALPEAMEILKIGDQEQQRLFSKHLFFVQKRLNFDANSDWRSFNFSRFKAKNVIASGDIDFKKYFSEQEWSRFNK